MKFIIESKKQAHIMPNNPGQIGFFFALLFYLYVSELEPQPMIKSNKAGLVLPITVFFLCIIAASLIHIAKRDSANVLVLGIGNADHLAMTYQRWSLLRSKRQEETSLTIPLSVSNALFGQPKVAKGFVKLDLLDGHLIAEARGLAKNQHYRLWLIGENRDPDQQSQTLAIGELSFIEDRHVLQTRLDRQALSGFHMQRVTLTETDKSAREALLAGVPDFLQKLYFVDKYWSIADLGFSSTNLQASEDHLPFAFLMPKPAYADALKLNREAALAEQIAKGRDLFLHETFGGNGRTCSTCHREDNNHTIDPKYIAQLPNDDPLFVAENNPDLKGLENPKLLRQLGLFLTNINGFDKPPVFRSSPHLLALSTSIVPEPEKEGLTVSHALGWSADGSVGDGSLRMFTVGAIVQHFPKTLARREGVDFRLPTSEELDALEAYMLSLGRAADPDLDSMYFSSPIVQRGRELFHSKEMGTGQCKGCHFNAGANSSTTLANGNRDTGVENMPDDPARLVWSPAAVDGGFGPDGRNDCGFGAQSECYGNGEFNMTTVIEAADTAPYFHNNSVNTLEEAIAFYNSKAFHNSPGAEPADPNDPNSICTRCIHLESTQITAIALFLRTLNVMENIRSSNDLDRKALTLLAAGQYQDGMDMLKLAMAETEDAIEVMEAGKLIPYYQSLRLLKQAYQNESQALNSNNQRDIALRLQAALSAKNEANALMLSDRPPMDSAKINALFDWAETTYPELFPEQSVSFEKEGFYMRQYATTGYALSVKNDRVYLSGGQFGSLTDIGSLEHWLDEKKNSSGT
ncbi:MAG: hypothetical protein Kow0065_12420 [Methylomicrobium sp.]